MLLQKIALPMASANTEYKQILPQVCIGYRVHLRDWTAFRFAYEAGKVATPVDPYESIPANGEKYEDAPVGGKFTDVILYLASANITMTAEIEVWTP